MSEEKKVYSVIGKVEIGTDEYRDLIEGLAAVQHDYKDADRRRWEEYRRANDAEAKLKEISEKYNELRAFVDSDENVQTKLKLFKIERADKEEI